MACIIQFTECYRGFFRHGGFSSTLEDRRCLGVRGLDEYSEFLRWTLVRNSLYIALRIMVTTLLYNCYKNFRIKFLNKLYRLRIISLVAEIHFSDIYRYSATLYKRGKQEQVASLDYMSNAKPGLEILVASTNARRRG